MPAVGSMYQSHTGFPRSVSAFFHQPFTERILISSRVSLMSSGCSTPSRLTVSVTSCPAGPVIESTALFSVQPTVAANGTLTYTPAANANGRHTYGAPAVIFDASTKSRPLDAAFGIQYMNRPMNWEVDGDLLTNTVPVAAYRGAGRPEGIYITERLIDIAARELKIDWSARTNPFPPQEGLHDYIRKARVEKAADEVTRGNVEAAFKGAAKVVSAEYEWPFQSHAPIAPACGVAERFAKSTPRTSSRATGSNSKPGTWSPRICAWYTRTSSPATSLR